MAEQVIFTGGFQRIQRQSGTLDHNVMDLIAPPPVTRREGECRDDVTLIHFLLLLNWDLPSWLQLIVLTPGDQFWVNPDLF